MARFRAMHTKHKHRQLSADEERVYVALRDDFSLALARAQRLSVQPGQMVRQVLRVASAMKLKLTIGGAPQSTLTLDVGPRGFAALIGTSLPVGLVVEFVLGGGVDPARGRARVVACDRHGSGSLSFRASFAVVAIAEADQARLDNAVIDAALAALGP